MYIWQDKYWAALNNLYYPCLDNVVSVNKEEIKTRSCSKYNIIYD